MAFALCAVCVTAAFLEHANQLARTPEHVGRARLTMGFTEGRRPDRVGQVVRSELATVLHSGAVHGNKKISGRLLSMISIVDIDMSPDLRNARVKVSIIGDRKDKISAVCQWSNLKGHGCEFTPVDECLRGPAGEMAPGQRETDPARAGAAAEGDEADTAAELPACGCWRSGGYDG